jgi:exonuclease VII small subunit
VYGSKFVKDQLPSTVTETYTGKLETSNSSHSNSKLQHFQHKVNNFPTQHSKMQSPKRLRTDSTTDLSSSASSNASMPSISSLIAPNAHPSSRSPSVSPSLSSAYPVAIYPQGHQQPQKSPEEQMTRLLSDVRALEQGQLNMLSDIAQLQDGLQTLRYGQRKLLQEVNGLQQALNNTNLLLTTLVNSVGCGCHGTFLPTAS